MNLHITVTFEDGISTLKQLLKKANDMSQILDTLTAQVAAVKTVGDSAITLLNGLKAKLDEAIASGDEAKLQELSDSLGAETQALADAVAANTVAEAAPVE